MMSAVLRFSRVLILLLFLFVGSYLSSAWETLWTVDVDVDGEDNLADDKSGGGKSRRKSVGDSPLDALFQMASKTFEGLKAKSGKHD